jgi:hypothetical protein
LIKQVANITTIFEPMGAWHFLNDVQSDQLHQQPQLQNNQISWFTKIIIYVGICLAVVI